MVGYSTTSRAYVEFVAAKGPFCASDCSVFQISSQNPSTSFNPSTSGSPSISNTLSMKPSSSQNPSSSQSLSQIPSTSQSPSKLQYCFKDGNPAKWRSGELYKAVDAYISQDCATNFTCESRQKYGDIGSWCTEKITDLHALFYNASSFNEPLNG